MNINVNLPLIFQESFGLIPNRMKLDDQISQTSLKIEEIFLRIADKGLKEYQNFFNESRIRITALYERTSHLSYWGNVLGLQLLVIFVHEEFCKNRPYSNYGYLYVFNTLACIIQDCYFTNQKHLNTLAQFSDSFEGLCTASLTGEGWEAARKKLISTFSEIVRWNHPKVKRSKLKCGKINKYDPTNAIIKKFIFSIERIRIKNL